jgi:hypothetical protein
MLIWTKFALCAAIVLSTAATASAATKKKTTAHRSGVSVQTSVPRPAPLVNPLVLPPQAGVPLATIKCSSAIEKLRKRTSLMLATPRGSQKELR